MEINTCGIQDDGSFIVNKGTPNQFCIPDDMGNRHRVMIQEWMDAGNVPEPYVGPTDLENWVNLGAGGALDGVNNMTDPFYIIGTHGHPRMLSASVTYNF